MTSTVGGKQYQACTPVLGTNLESEWFVPKTGLLFIKGYLVSFPFSLVY